MESREDHIYQEAAALWQALFHAPAPPNANGTALLDMIARQAPIATYERLNSPHLRATNITGPSETQNYG